MPSSSEQQRKFVYAKRSEYGSKGKTPEKFKWVWNDDWLTVKKENQLKRYKPLLSEWQPEAFQKARQSGLLDVKVKGKVISDWLLQLISDYNSSLDKIQHNVKKNSFYTKNDRIVIYNNNFYTSNKLLHVELLIYLFIHEGLNFKNDDEIIDWQEHLNWPFICLHAGYGESDYYQGNGIWLAESYTNKQAKDLEKLVNANHNHWLTVIQKIEHELKIKFQPYPKI